MAAAVAYWRGRREEVVVRLVRRREKTTFEGGCNRGGMVGNSVLEDVVSLIEGSGSHCMHNIRMKLRGVL